MSFIRHLEDTVRDLNPGSFAFVMATGIVSIDAAQNGLPGIGTALFWINCIAYACLLALTLARLTHWRRQLVANFVAPGQGARFLTLIAGTCVLASQCLLVVTAPRTGYVLAMWGVTCWFGLVYLFLCMAITRRVKASLDHTLHGGWLIVVVATQAIAVIATLIAARETPVVREDLLFTAVCFYLIGCVWYFILITLITYRMVVLRFTPPDLTPPYWIDMGALAISTLAGSLIILHAPPAGPMHDLLPFVRGLTLLCWAFATWWIPLLLMLGWWRHVRNRVPLVYDAANWNIVFPVGMYSVCTGTLAAAMHADELAWVSGVGVYASLGVWALTAFGLGRRLLRWGRMLWA